ncbi:MAG: hypothetical protein GDA43_18285 [Hormoscilla sp. SP5CHS1]|nr:hypothetical protein [Hormoscilla sp. SP12CHS1]MBC6454905.1 hypothetical protein [Hormoscilla sp. SP5CHS1]
MQKCCPINWPWGKSLYQVDQQVKFLHLQAEVESLWQQLQVLKQQRQASQEAKVLASTVTVAEE